MKYNSIFRIQAQLNKLERSSKLSEAGQNDLFKKSKTTPEDVRRMYSVAATKAGTSFQDWFAESGAEQIQFLSQIKNLGRKK